MRLIGAAIILMALSIRVDAAGQQYRVWGFGVRSCGTWIADKEDQQMPWKRLIDIAWVEGFLSAADRDNALVNAASHRTDSDAMAAWKDQYSAANPLAWFFDAAGRFSLELGQ